ncbi:MAG: hypothetical protein RBT71_14520, partial [Flavobacteriales bacterium]|nr:hypothetical protein [Flavobacteriales bacterium]
VCLGEAVALNLDATDPNGHTMTYTLVDALRAVTLTPPPPTWAPIWYETGYTGAEPIPGITIDPVTGQLEFTPTLMGYYTVVVQVTTHDAAGDLIGHVKWDMTIAVVPCPTVPPEPGGLSNISGGQITGGGTIAVCDGADLCVDYTFNDPDPASVVAVTSSVAAVLPGATTSLAPGNPAVLTICWTVDAAALPAAFLLTATDDDCPFPNANFITLHIGLADPPAIMPHAGTGATVGTCTALPDPLPLFPFITDGPQTGGQWTAPNGTIHSGVFDPLADPLGDYLYVVGSACEADTAVITIVADPGAFAGDDASLELCGTDAATDLFPLLGPAAQGTGTWSGPAGAFNGTIDPATDPPGAYVYTVAGISPCPDHAATVTVQVHDPTDAGTDALVTLCTSDTPLDLFTALGGTPQNGGAWTGPNGVSTGMLDPAVDDPGAYTYTITGTPPCADDAATVTVAVNTATDAGQDGDITLCTSDAPVDLFSVLGGTPQTGGTWNGPNGAFGGSFDPATDDAGTYTYTVTGMAPCADDISTVAVTVHAAADAGSDANITLCSSDVPVDLFTALGGTPQTGGTWSGPNGAFNGTFDPATDDAGAYTYTVVGTAPCADDVSSATVTVQVEAVAGTDAAIVLCATDAPVDLFAQLGGTPQTGGTWTGPNGTFTGMFDPAIDAPGDHVYTVTGVAPCVNAWATVAVTVHAAADAGADADITLCSSDAPVDLFSVLGGTPQTGGTWSGPNGAFSGTFDPAIDDAGTYTYTVAGTVPCADAAATVDVIVHAAADAGADASITLCTSDAPVDLFNVLGGTPQTGGTWSGPNGAFSGTFDPATDDAGTYTYTVAGTEPCADEPATVYVIVRTAA